MQHKYQIHRRYRAYSMQRKGVSHQGIWQDATQKTPWDIKQVPLWFSTFPVPYPLYTPYELVLSLRRFQLLALRKPFCYNTLFARLWSMKQEFHSPTFFYWL